MRILTPVVLLALLALGACTAAKNQTASDKQVEAKIRVAAASDLQFALEEIDAAFARTQPGVSVEPQFGSSGSFATQIEQGAPFDVFLSADVAYARRLVDKRLALEDSFVVYGIGRIVVWVPNGSPIDVETKGLAALASPYVRTVAIANPEHAPYGRAAEAALKSSGIYDAVKPKLVLGENVTQAAQFVQSGSADVGIIARSLAETPKMKSAGRFWEVPRDLYPRLEQAGIVLSTASDPAAARAYVKYLAGQDAQAVLRRFGFSPP